MDSQIQEVLVRVRELAELEAYDEIIRQLHDLTDEYPESFTGPYWLAYYKMFTGKMDDALLYVDVAIKRAPFEAGPTLTYASILYKLERYKDARVQLDILRSLDRANRYVTGALDLLEKIYHKALELVFSSEFANGFETRLCDAVEMIIFDRCKVSSLDEYENVYRISGIAHNYMVWITDDNTLSIQIDDAADSLHEHVIFKGSLQSGLLKISQLPSSGIHKFKVELDQEPFFKAIIHICDLFNKDPKRLFYIEHGMDSGEWGPEEEFEPSDYQRAIDAVSGAYFGYQINFDLETWWGWVKGRSNIGYGTWIEAEGSQEMIQRLERAISKALP